jgi:hypothetical protein
MIHFMKCTNIVEQPGMYIDISFWLQLFIRPAGWPVTVGWDRDLLLPGVTPTSIQVPSQVKVNWHQP